MSRAPTLLSPLSLAAYLTWLAVAIEPALRLSQQGWPPAGWTLAGVAASLAMLLLFIARDLSTSLARRRALALAQLPMALVAFAAFRDGLQPVLMILVAAQLATLFPARITLLVLTVANALMLALMLEAWPLLRALLSAAAYAGFQGFAALTAHALAAAQTARDEARHINAELLATRALLAEGARAEERLHLSRELHDLAGHKLTALKLQLARADTDPAAALPACRQLADELLADVRGVVGAFRAHDGVDLHQALTGLAGAIPDPRIALALDADARPADLARAQALLRSAQEGVTNALRHSGGQQLGIRLWRDAAGLHLAVEDDGRGPGAAPAGNGLKGLEERLAAVGGRLDFGPREGGGTRLLATVPA